MLDASTVNKVCEIAAAVIPVLWLAVAVDLRVKTFVDSPPFAEHPDKRDAWLAGIATVMVASGFAEAVTFYGLTVSGYLAPGLFWPVLLVLYALIGLVLLLILYGIFPDDWHEYLFLGSSFLVTLLLLLSWPVHLPLAIAHRPGGVASPAGSEEAAAAGQRIT